MSARPSGVPATGPERPTGRSTYFDAIAVYERGIRALQEHDYGRAADLLHRVVAGFPQERELVERARVYLNLCARHLTPPAAEPGNAQERLYAATLAINAGDPDGAIRHLERVLVEEPLSDRALYLQAVANLERGATADAIRYLQQAIDANPENRALARVDPDLEALRDLEAVSALLETRPVARHAHHAKRAPRRQ